MKPVDYKAHCKRVLKEALRTRRREFLAQLADTPWPGVRKGWVADNREHFTFPDGVKDKTYPSYTGKAKSGVYFCYPRRQRHMSEVAA